MRIPATPPSMESMTLQLVETKQLPDHISRLMEGRISPAPDGRYLHWDTLRHIAPPEGLSVEGWWFVIKMARGTTLHRIPLRDKKGSRFVYTTPDVLYKMLSRIDKEATGTLQSGDQVTNPHVKDSYIFHSILEEAITSSQLEGATTTRQVAKEMIRTGRPPRDVSEQMILNNYEAMQFIQRIKDQPLTPGIVFELHEIITKSTLKNSDAAGRLRRGDEQICVEEELTGEVLHDPPPASELRERMDAMCAFANDDGSSEYMHEVVRAILLHFWLAYDHPFVDGNGRTARALFYWAMARHGYWLFEFISISRILRKAPAKYARAFLYTETDSNDATYFVLNQLGVIIRAIEELYADLRKKSAELYKVREILLQSNTAEALYNHRQMALLNHALKNPGHAYSIESHRRSHNISYQTARTDLLGLASRGLLNKTQFGKTFYFYSPIDLHDRIHKAATTTTMKR